MFDGDGVGFVVLVCVLWLNLVVIMLIVKGMLLDKVEGLDVGVDDYLVKLVVIEELMVCICVVLCRFLVMVMLSLWLGWFEFDFELL